MGGKQVLQVASLLHGQLHELEIIMPQISTVYSDHQWTIANPSQNINNTIVLTRQQH